MANLCRLGHGELIFLSAQGRHAIAPSCLLSDTYISATSFTSAICKYSLFLKYHYGHILQAPKDVSEQALYLGTL